MTKDCPVDIAQYEWEFDTVIDLYKRARPKTLLEIGSLYGGTLYHWLNGGESDLSAMCLDLFHTEDYIITSNRWHSWCSGGQKLFVMKADSTAAGTILAVRNNFPSGIDWLFIDGGHDYPTARSDYDNYFPMITKNGHCVIHDIFGEEGVARLWNEIKHDKCTMEVRHRKHNLGIGIIQKWEP